MEFDELLAQVIALLQRQGRVSYGALKRRFKLDDDYLEDLKVELIEAQGLAADEQGRILIWLGSPAAAPLPTAPSVSDTAEAPLAYTPPYLTEKILASRATLEGERKQVTVLFADTKGSMELIQGLDPEDARRLLDPAIHQMMDAVHRYEGTVNQVLGDGIMALFGAPLAHEDHALRACYAALAMQAAMRDYTEEMRRTHGLEVRIRVGLNSGEVVVRTIGNDLHMDYSAVGQTTHLAARMEQLAAPGSIRLTAATLRLVEGLVRVNALGPVPVKGLADAVEVFELVGASAVRRRLQAAVARGLTRFVGRETELAALQQALERAVAGHGQVVAVVGEAGVGKSRLVYECVHSHRTQGWRVLESASVSYGKATPYFPVIDLLKRYAHVEEQDDPRTIRAKVTGQVMTLDEALQDAIPALLSLLEALPADSPFLTLDPPQRRQRTLTALKRVLLRESQVQPLLLVCEDLHWIDAETQALLDSLIESLPTAQILLLVNYRPEYQHSWGSKTYYTQLRLALRSALQPSGDSGRILASLREAESLAAALDDPRRLAQVSLLLSLHFYFMGAYDQAIAAAQRALALATASGEVVLQALANRYLGQAYHAQGDYRRAIDCLGQTVAFFEGARRRERFGQVILPAVLSRAYLAWCHAELGTFAEGRALGEEGLRIAEAVASPREPHDGLVGVGLLSLRQGDLPRALPLLERAVGLCQDADLPAYFPRMAAALGAAYTLSGRVADAVPLLTQAMEQTIATETAGYQALCSLPLGEAHC